MSTVTRRGFVEALGAVAVAPAIVRARGPNPLGCRSASLPRGARPGPCARSSMSAAQRGTSAIELRGSKARWTSTKRPEFSSSLASTVAELRARNLRRLVPRDRRRSSTIAIPPTARSTWTRRGASSIWPRNCRRRRPRVRRQHCRRTEVGARRSRRRSLCELDRACRAAAHGPSSRTARVTDSATLTAILTAAARVRRCSGMPTTRSSRPRKRRPTRKALGSWGAPHAPEGPHGLRARCALRAHRNGTGRCATPAGAGRGRPQGLLQFEWEKKWHPEIEEPEMAIPQVRQGHALFLRGGGRVVNHPAAAPARDRRAARRAGSHAATTAMTPSARGAPTNVTGSDAPTPRGGCRRLAPGPVRDHSPQRHLRNWRHDLADRERDHLRRARAERHADAHLARASRHRVGAHAVYAECASTRATPAKPPSSTRSRASATAARDHLLHRRHPRDGHVRIHGPHHALRRARSLQDPRCPHHERQLAGSELGRMLCAWHVDLGGHVTGPLGLLARSVLTPTIVSQCPAAGRPRPHAGPRGSSLG